jgi:hypothetical protein
MDFKSNQKPSVLIIRNLLHNGGGGGHLNSCLKYVLCAKSYLVFIRCENNMTYTISCISIGTLLCRAAPSRHSGFAFYFLFMIGCYECICLHKKSHSLYYEIIVLRTRFLVKNV